VPPGIERLRNAKRTHHFLAVASGADTCAVESVLAPVSQRRRLWQTRRRNHYCGCMWRDGGPADDDTVVALCLALNVEDPGPFPVTAEQVRRTLAEFRNRPWRGKVSVLEIGGLVHGYAFLNALWSNELGGEVCVIDELYVIKDFRGLGHATSLLEGIQHLWGRPVVAAALETSSSNQRADAFYRRLGFDGSNTAMVLRFAAPGNGDVSS
jgi:ribosomal protein S18 acetylase RimI-like enzyme